MIKEKPKERMSIAMLIPSLGGGGAERVFVNLANYFSSEGHSVSLVTSRNGSYSSQVSSEVNVITLARVGHLEIKGKFGAIRHLFKFFIEARKEVSKCDIDILFCTLNVANIVGYLIKSSFRKRKFKLVLRQANIILGSNTSNIMKLLLKKSFQGADLIISNSPDTEKSIRNLLKKEHHFLKIKTAGNPVFTSSLQDSNSTNLTDHSGLIGNRKYILNVGSLREKKDHSTLIKMLAIVRDTHDIDLLILGDGPLKNKLIRLAEELGVSDNVIFVGYVDNPYPYYANAELFVLSSIFEGFGNVIVEALSFGLPIVSTNCQGGPTFILENGKYGDLVPIGNSQAMADSVIYRLNNLGEIDKQKLKDRANDFSIEKIGREYLEIITSIRT